MAKYSRVKVKINVQLKLAHGGRPVQSFPRTARRWSAFQKSADKVGKGRRVVYCVKKNIKQLANGGSNHHTSVAGQIFIGNSQPYKSRSCGVPVPVWCDKQPWAQSAHGPLQDAI